MFIRAQRLNSNFSFVFFFSLDFTFVFVAFFFANIPRTPFIEICKSKKMKKDMFNLHYQNKKKFWHLIEFLLITRERKAICGEYLLVYWKYYLIYILVVHFRCCYCCSYCNQKLINSDSNIIWIKMLNF